MSGTARRAEFFALEATEYIGELEPLTVRTEPPDAERLVRGARALRGAALMAGLGTFARAAAGLEGIARQVRDNALEWAPDAHGAWREGLQTLRALVGRATAWEAGDDRQALALSDRLERVAGGRPAQVVAPEEPATPTGAMTPGVRAFIARESALIAGSLKEASQALAPTPPPEALAGVLDRMRSLRGIGTSADLSPLPELLDAMEVATRGLLSGGRPTPEVAAVFSDAAEALTALAKSVGDHGRVVIPPGLEGVARRLLSEHLVPPAKLGPGGAPDEADDQVFMPIPIELVGVGDHLIAQGDAMARQSSPTARDLRLFVLHRTLGAMPPESGTGRFLAPLVRAITTAISGGAAAQRPDAFASLLRDAGKFLIEAGESRDPSSMTSRRDGLAQALLQADEVESQRPNRVGETSRSAPATDSGFSDTEGVPAARHLDPPRRAVRTSPPVTTIRGLEPKAENPAPPTVPIEESVPPETATAEGLTSVESLAPNDRKHSEELVSIESLAPSDPDPINEVVSIESLAPSESEPRDELVSIESLAPDAVVHSEELVSIESLAPDSVEPLEELVSIESLAPDSVEPLEELVSIESLAPPKPEHTEELVSIESLAPGSPEPAPDGEPGRLEAAFRSLNAVTARRGAEPPSIEALRGEAPVTVDALLYRGETALARAEELRTELAVILAEPTVSLERLRPLLDELLDLVPLARDAA